MNDPHGLERFVEAQESVYPRVRAELETGRKRTHWMWFVFPQLRGLGESPTSRRFAIGSLAEARAYLEHPLLGPRLLECTRLVNAVEGRTLSEIFGFPDDLKFRSCMTLFAAAGGPDQALFDAALRKYCKGVPDDRTLGLLAASSRLAKG
jgi:uncharacterized protein (DUF1810 family)